MLSRVPGWLGKAIGLVGLCVLVQAAAAAEADIHKSFAKSASVVAYNPPGLSPANQSGLLPAADVERDLRRLRGAGFDGLVTYSAMGERI